MNCPRCNVEMSSERHFDIPIDRCPQCQGILLERGRAEAIDDLDLGPSIESGARQDPASIPDGPARCYQCNQEMIAISGVGDIEFDWCAGCERIFFDKGELSAFDAAVGE